MHLAQAVLQAVCIGALAGSSSTVFVNYHPDVLAALPACVSDQLPIIFTHRGACERSVLEGVTVAIGWALESFAALYYVCLGLGAQV